MVDRFLREPDVASMTGLSRTARYMLEKSGQFPARRRIGPGAIGWLESELVEWMRSRAAGPHAAPKSALKARGITA